MRAPWAIVVLLLSPAAAMAEKAEKTISASGIMALPSCDPQKPTEVDAVGWGAGVSAHYGATRDLDLGAGFRFAHYAGVAPSYTMVREGEEVTGSLWFNGGMYLTEGLARYKLFGGYELAPYLELGVGYAWSTYLDPLLYDDAEQRKINIDVEDFGDGSPALSVAVLADWRVGGFLRIGLGARFTWLPDGILSYTFEVPLTVSYYRFLPFW